MSTESKKVWVVGHKNPDTDSICAAISYAYLKNQSGDKKTYVAKRAGAVNEETRYVLERFGVEEPPLVTYAGAQIKDINIRKTARCQQSDFAETGMGADEKAGGCNASGHQSVR